MEWFISEEKAYSILSWIKKFLNQKICTLKEAQKLHGKLNHFAQVCEFMLGFRSNLMELIRKFKGSETTKKLIPAVAFPGNFFISREAATAERRYEKERQSVKLYA